MSLKCMTLLLSCIGSSVLIVSTGYAAGQPGQQSGLLLTQPASDGMEAPFDLKAPVPDQTDAKSLMGGGSFLSNLDNAAPARGLQPAARSTREAAPAKVDDSALRFYASQNDSARVAMEIKRLKALNPAWEPPSDLFSDPGDPAVEQKLWDLFGEGRLDDIRLAVENIRKADPAWRPSEKLVREFDRAQTRLQLIAASDAKDAQGVLAIAEANSNMLVCTDVDSMWRVAEALVHTSQEDRAQELYKYILTRCPNPAERLATVQKAMELLPAPSVKALMASARYRNDNGKTFETVQLDLLRRQIGAVASDPAATPVPPADLRAFETLVKQKKLSNDAALLGWHYYSLKSWPVAADWFKQAMDWDKLPKAAEGYALALRQQGQVQDAEAVAYEWRDASPLIGKLFVEIVATTLTQPSPPTMDEARLARVEQVVQAIQSANGGQALGWYYYNKNVFSKARQWFEASVAWETKESSVLGLALAANRTNDKTMFRKVLADYGKQYAAIAALQSYDRPQVVARKGGSKAGGGSKGGGGSSQAGQLANAAVEQFKNGQYREALATLDKRSAVAREDQGLGVLRGWSLYHLNQYDKARSQFADLDKKQSNRDTQYGLYYSGIKLDPTHIGDF
jgi:tetratricopeptide (TPR) repeat protein